MANHHHPLLCVSQHHFGLHFGWLALDIQCSLLHGVEGEGESNVPQSVQDDKPQHIHQAMLQNDS